MISKVHFAEQEENTFVQASLWNFHRSIEWLGICSSGVSVDNVPLMSITTTLRLPFRPCLYLIITWTLEFIWWRVDKAVEPRSKRAGLPKGRYLSNHACSPIGRHKCLLPSTSLKSLFPSLLFALLSKTFSPSFSKWCQVSKDIELRCQKLFNRKFCENHC